MTKNMLRSDFFDNNYTEIFEIIVIEDDEGLCHLLKKALTRVGYIVKVATSGKEALNVVRGDIREILIVDYKLHDLNAKQLIKKLSDKFNYQPSFITLTGYGNEKIAVEMMKLGSSDYIVKEPDFIEVLPEVLKQVCESIVNRQKLASTEIELHKKLELLKETGEMARVGAWEIDFSTNQVYWTDATKEIHEVPDDYLPTMEEAINFFPGESKVQLENALKDAIQNGKEYDLELKFKTAKGNDLWVHTIGKPNIKDGKCVRLHGTFQDITPRKEAEKELKINNAILKRTEEIAQVGSWEWDVASDTVTWSDELFRIFKLDPKKGAPSYADHPKIYTPESMKKLDEAVKQCLKSGKPYELDLEIIPGDGKNAFCIARGLAKKDNSGKVVRLFGSFQDITHRKEAEELLKARNRQLTALNQQLTASEQQLRAANQQLAASEQQLRAANQQLAANEQQLRAANQQLAANEQQLRAANQQLIAHEKELIKERHKLVESEERYRKSQEAGHIGSWEFNLETNEFWGSDEGKRIYNLNPDEIEFPADEVMNLVAEKDRDSVNQAMIDLISDNKPYDITFEITPKNTSEKKIIRSIAELEKDKNGKPQKVSGVLLDITKQKLAELQLTESEKKYRALYQNAPLAYQSLNINGEIIDVNPQWLNALGYPREKVIGKWFGNFLQDESRIKFRNQFEQFKKKGTITGVEFGMICSDDDEITVSFEGYIGHDEKGNFKQTYCTFKDITEQKKAEQKIRESESFLKAIFDNSLNAIVVSDDQGNYISVNDAAVSLLGYSKKELLKMNVADLRTVEEDGAFKKFKEYISKNRDSDEFEFVTPDGIQKTALYSAIRIKKDFNLSILADITDRKQVELELIKAKEKAEESDQLKSAFLANMSHEIRTPMNGILGFTNLLKNPNLSTDRQLRFIDIIQKSGNRMLETVNALIDISKIETGQVDVHLEQFDVNAEIGSLFDFFKTEANEKGLTIDLEKKFPVEQSLIFTDKNKLNSVFSNLIKNAIKYTDDGFVKIGLEQKDGQLHFYVKDSGIGVPDDRHEAIFNRFEQADVRDTRAFQGSGLGLAIVKAYVEMLKGNVGVDSKPGKGSTFWVTLPVLQKSRENVTILKEEEITEKPNLRKPKIIIADDDEVTASHFKFLLQDHSRELLFCKTGRETIELCKKYPDVDVILMDVKMPELNGYEATKEIRKFNKKVNIIAQTAYALDGDREKAMDAGCDEYISKPIDKEKLFIIIKQILKRDR